MSEFVESFLTTAFSLLSQDNKTVLLEIIMENKRPKETNLKERHVSKLTRISAQNFKANEGFLYEKVENVYIYHWLFLQIPELQI